MVGRGPEVAVFQPLAAGGGDRRRQEAEAGEAPQPDHQVQVFRVTVSKATQGEEQVPAHENGLVAIGQAKEAAAPVGPPGDEPEEGGGRVQAEFEGPGPDPGVQGRPAQGGQMVRGQDCVDMQEYEKISPGQAGARIHLDPPAPGGAQPADVGEASRHFPGGVGAAAVHQDNFQIRGPGQG